MLAASASSDLVTSLLPFVLLFGFWLFLTRRVREQGRPQEQLVEKLEEIRTELERLRQTIENRVPEEDRFGFRS